MKIIMRDKKGREKLVCESIDQIHGEMVVKLLNGNFYSKNKALQYYLVDMNYRTNFTDSQIEGQTDIFEFLG